MVQRQNTMILWYALEVHKYTRCKTSKSFQDFGADIERLGSLSYPEAHKELIQQISSNKFYVWHSQWNEWNHNAFFRIWGVYESFLTLSEMHDLWAVANSR